MAMISQMYPEVAPSAIADALAALALSSPTPVRRLSACRLSARESLKRRSVRALGGVLVHRLGTLRTSATPPSLSCLLLAELCMHAG